MKELAFQYITKSLTTDNVAYEVFSDFSAAFEDVRKVRPILVLPVLSAEGALQVEVQFFLDHWADIRGSDAMRNIWQQIRVGRHPGFEEGEFTLSGVKQNTNTDILVVWPLIAVNLEFKPKQPDTNNARDGADT